MSLYQARSDYINVFILGRKIQNCHFYFRNIWLKFIWKSKVIFRFEINIPSQLLKLWTKKIILAKNSSGVRKRFAMTCWPILCIAHITAREVVWDGGYFETRWQRKGYFPQVDPLWLQQGRMQHLKAIEHLVHLCHTHFYIGIPPTAEYAAPKSSNALKLKH